MNFEEYKAKCVELIGKRDNIEQRITYLTTFLTSPGTSAWLMWLGPNGEPAPGIKESLVDKEGFPRSDIDLYDVSNYYFFDIQIRDKRHELNCLQHDYMDHMSQIELLLQNVLHFIVL